MLDKLGSPDTYNHYPTGWATAFSTPFKMFKRYTYQGGVADPLVISWPKGIAGARRGRAPSTTTPSTSCRPSSSASASRCPSRCRATRRSELPGVSMKYTFDADGPTQKEIQYYEMFGTRALWHEGWHVVAQRAPQQGATAADFVNETWELYHSDEDRAEVHDLAGRAPGEGQGAGQPLVRRGRQVRRAAARQPVDRGPAQADAGRRRSRRAASTATTRTPPRCRSSRPRRSAGRSFKILAQVDLDRRRRGGRDHRQRRAVRRPHALHQGPQALVRQQLPRHPAGAAAGLARRADGRARTCSAWSSSRRATASTARRSAPPPSTSTTSRSPRATWKTQPGHFALCGEGLTVGRDGSDPVIEGVRRAVRLHRRPDPGGRDQHRRRPLPRPRARLPRRHGARLIPVSRRVSGWAPRTADLPKDLARA